MNFNMSEIRKIDPPKSEKFFDWLDGFLTERESLNTAEVEALKKQLKIYSTPGWLVPADWKEKLK